MIEEKKSGLKCPRCYELQVKVLETRARQDGSTYRRRICEFCQATPRAFHALGNAPDPKGYYKFSTRERVENFKNHLSANPL